MKDEARKLRVQGSKVLELISDLPDDKINEKVKLANDYVGEVDALWSATGKTTHEEIESKKVHPITKVYVAFELLNILLSGRSYSGGGVISQEKDEEKSLAVVEPKDYYETLGVSENATSKEIKTAYQNRLKSLDLNELETKLRKQGLSEYEIKSRLEKARQEYNNLREAYTGVGSEENRKYYDDYRNRHQGGDQKSSSWKTQPAGNAYNWEVLGVGPNPTQLELRSAYRNKVKELHPDSYLSQLGKKREDLTPEEIKILNEREEKLREVNSAYEKGFDQQQLSKEIDERRVEKQAQSTKDQNNIVIETTPTIVENEESKKELKKTKKYRETVQNVGTIEVTPEENAELISRGVVPDNTTPTETSSNITTAVNLHERGAPANIVSKAIDTAVDEKIITPQQGTSLQGAAFALEAIEKENPKLSNSLYKAHQEPSVTIFQLPANVSTPQPNQIILQSPGGGENFFQPLLETAVGKGKDIVEGEVEKVVVKGLEKKGVSTAAKSATKKVAIEAVKKSGEQAVKQGAKIATKAGLKTGFKAALIAAGAPTAGVSLIIWLGMEALELLAKVGLKLIRGFLKFITGKDDLKSQLGTLSLYGLAASIAMGSMGFAIAAAGSFLLFSGVGSVGATIAGAFTAFITVITATVIAISTPVLISVFVFLFLVIFIITIINNSAFVVPMGGYGTSEYQIIPIGDFECTLEKGPVSFENNLTSSSIASRAWEITADLYQGFWCYWNRSPDDSERLAELLGSFPPDVVDYPPSYPDIFDEVFFVENPFPAVAEVQNDSRVLFWCTRLVVTSYQSEGSDILVDYNSQRLQDWFIAEGRFIEASNANSTNIPDGSIVFFYIPSRGRVAHVAIVHHIIPNQAIVYVQSNSGFKDEYLSFEDDGTGVINPTWARITGFGLP